MLNNRLHRQEKEIANLKRMNKIYNGVLCLLTSVVTVYSSYLVCKSINSK